MKIVREYDIKQIIEFESTDKDKRELVKEILFNQMTLEDSDKLIAEILEDLRSTEEDFEKTMNREIKTDLENILSLIACARDYGFEDDVLFDAFKEMLEGKLSEEEIEWYARLVESEDGYTEEDYEAIKERLKDFKNKYCA